MICEELKIACTIQMRRFDTLIASLDENRGDAVIASIAATPETRAARRFHRSLLPHAGALRGAARLAASTIRCRRSSRAGRSPWSPAPRTRPISRRCSPRWSCAPIRHADVARDGAAPRRRRSDVRRRHLARVLAQRHRVRRTAARSAAGPSSTAAISAKASASRSGAATTPMRLALNWALFRLWEQGRFTDSVAAVFSDQPVLSLSGRFDAARRAT